MSKLYRSHECIGKRNKNFVSKYMDIGFSRLVYSREHFTRFKKD